jgi:hypothetical protein
MKTMFLTRSMAVGGAQRQLCKELLARDRALAGALAQGETFSRLRAERVRGPFSPRSLAERTELALSAALEHTNTRVTCGSFT